MNGTWDLILSDPSCYHTDAGCLPQDPLMIESVDPRAGTNPVTGDAIALSGNPTGNSINGSEYDISARDVMFADGQWARAKGYDTFCPLGPWIETELDISNLEIQTFVDGEPRRHGNTGDMLYKIPEIIEFASSVWTLLPGDVICTGTPAGLGGFTDGQTVDITIRWPDRANHHHTRQAQRSSRQSHEDLGVRQHPLRPNPDSTEMLTRWMADLAN